MIHEQRITIVKQQKKEGAYLMIFDENLNLCCGCSLESPRRGDSNNEHPQHRFL